MEEDVRDRRSESQWWHTENNCSVLVRLRTRRKLHWCQKGIFFFFLWFRDDWRGQRNCFQHTGWTHTKLEFQDIFSSGLHGLGQIGVTKHKTNTDDASPICQNPRRLPIAQREEAFKAVEEMHALGIIEPSRGLGRTWKSENVFRRAPTKAPNFPSYFYGIAFFCKKED